ncbi:galactose-1-phosphate uridylyltransferase [Pseudonocardiaceae bacterium YIM PH 21723]|nr:galactose-1-phosphate uridylyltransferase [Pseudonocardiaceae bacterium YIM PH 21723]
MRRTSNRLADGREIIYFDDSVEAPERTAADRRDLPERDPRPEMRRDPLTGEWTVLAAHRQARTYKPATSDCPLCPSRPGSESEIPESGYDVVVFENRFPSLFGPPGELSGVPAESARAAGRCEVVCYTDKHDGALKDVDLTRMDTVLLALADRTAELGALPGVKQVYCFENRGEAIGTTLPHPHGQIYAFPFIAPRTQRMLEMAAAADTHPMGTLLAAEHADGARVVHRGEHCSVIVPVAARWPVEVLVVPHRQVGTIGELTEDERTEFGAFYLDLLDRLDRYHGQELPYVAAWHQAPVDTDPKLSWLHLQVFSIQRTPDKLKYLAGTESGAGVWISDVTPESIAERLRSL